MSAPKSGEVVIGTKPAWELWAETEIKRISRGEVLLKRGCFTVNDFKRKCPGWTRTKVAAHLYRTGLKSEVAGDPREYNGRPVRFYFPPGVKP